MLHPVRPVQPKPKLSFPYEYSMSIRGSTTQWDKHEAARLRRVAAARALLFNKCPVDFEYLVYKLLQVLKADENLATGFAAESIYCHAQSLIYLGADYELFKETLAFFQRTVEDWNDGWLLRKSDDGSELWKSDDRSELRKSEDGFVEPPAKKLKLSIREKHYRMVNFVERCLRRYILEDYSISILDDRPNHPPPSRLIIPVKKSVIRYLFYDTGLSSNVFEQFFEEVPAQHS